MSEYTNVEHPLSRKILEYRWNGMSADKKVLENNEMVKRGMIEKMLNEKYDNI